MNYETMKVTLMLFEITCLHYLFVQNMDCKKV